jgi:hypothetical protein
MNKAGLWSWFMFESGLGTHRAKELLAAWDQRAWSLEEALRIAGTEPKRVGLTPAEAKQLIPPGLLPFVDALAWDDPYYPVGLNRLSIRLRPALLFYLGEPALTAHPIIYLAPADLEPGAEDNVREIVNLLIGEDLLFAAYSQSLQARILLDELAYGQGAALIFANAGLEAYPIGKGARALLAQERLLLMSPLPPKTPQRPSLAAVLEHVAMAAADRIILTGTGDASPTAFPELADTPTIAVYGTDHKGDPAPNVRQVDAPTDILTWIGLTSPLTQSAEDPTIHPEAAAPPRATAPPQDNPDETYALRNSDLGPPPSPDEILDTLKRGGSIPEALRRRLEE